MTASPDFQLLLQRMRTMSAGDLSVLHASLERPESVMITPVGSPNDILWSEMAAFGWMRKK
jgi:hypothetical protein